MLEFHPLANLFPLIEGQAFDDLVADVKANGILDEIVMLDGRILDGRNRYRAGIAAGVLAEDVGPEDRLEIHQFSDTGIDGVLASDVVSRGPLAWVLSKNLHRRHLDESQRSAVGARLETLGHGGRRTSRRGSRCKFAAEPLDRRRDGQRLAALDRQLQEGA